jgi:hypothetical protein
MLEGLGIALLAWALVWVGCCLVAALASGWLSWSRTYACPDRPLEGDVLAPFALAFRPPIFFFQYPMSVRVGASAHGLHLRTNLSFPVFHKSLRVPWSDVRVSERKLLFFKVAIFEFADVAGAKFVVGSGAYTALRRKARLYWSPAEGSQRDPESLAPAPSPFAGGETIADSAPTAGQETSPYTDAGDALRLPASGGAIGPAREAEPAFSVGGLPGRLALAGMVAVLFVGMLNWIGIFSSGDGAVEPDGGALLVEVDPDADSSLAELVVDARDLAESDDACPSDTFAMGERFPDGLEIYCLHADQAVRHGPFVAWHENGTWKARGEYRMGKRHGHWIKYDPEGRVQVEAGFDNDQKHGVLRVYAADGSVKSETTWDHGQRRS